MFYSPFLPINHEISQIIRLHRTPAMHLITFPGRVHHFRHSWPTTTTMSPQLPGHSPQPQGRPPTGLVHHPYFLANGRELAPVLGLFVILIWNSYSFFLNLRQVFFSHIFQTLRRTCTSIYQYNIEVPLPDAPPAHFLRFKSLHVPFSTDTAPVFFLPPPPWHCEFPA